MNVLIWGIIPSNTYKPKPLQIQPFHPFGLQTETCKHQGNRAGSYGAQDIQSI